MRVLRRLGSILGCLEEFRTDLGTSWEYLGPSGMVLEASWSRLGTSWVVLGRHVGVMRVSCRYLVPDVKS